MTDPSNLPMLVRAHRYREFAVEAARDAERTKGSVRESYLMLQAGWLQLAEDIEGAVKRDGERNDLENKQAAFRRQSAPDA